MTIKKIILLLMVMAVIAATFVLDIGQYFSFDYIKSQQVLLSSYVDQHVWLSLALFFVLYVVTIAFSIPGAAILTLLAGALFGLVKGLILVSFASTIGATLAFLVARFLFREGIQQKFGDKLKLINNGVEKEGAFYLFGLRLVPIFPFFLINLLMAVTPIKTWVFYWVSQLGMLPGTAVYVNAGTQLSKLQSPAGILSPTIIFSFVLLALFPLLAKKVLTFMRGRS